MQSMQINGLSLFYAAEDHSTAILSQDTCEKSTDLIRQHWGLNTPQELRVYIMTSWQHFIFHSAPWFWQPLLVLTMPLWYSRIRNLWQYAGGWAQRYGRRCAIGVKPARLIRQADRSLGERIFVKEDTDDEKIRHITCHELTHAFTAHLNLPMWLNEGMAMLMVDRLLGKQTVKPETLKLLNRSADDTTLRRVGKITTNNRDAVLILYSRGYWLTRYLEELQPGLIRSLLTRPHSHAGLENRITDSLNMNRETFRKTIDNTLADYFSNGQQI